MWKHQAIIVTEKKVSQEASAEYGGNLFALLTFNVPVLFISFFSILLLLPFLTSAEYGGNLFALLDKNLIHSQFWYQVHKVWTKLIFTTTRALSCVDFELFRRFLSSTSLMQSSFGQINVDACNTSWGLELRSFQTAYLGNFGIFHAFYIDVGFNAHSA